MHVCIFCWILHAHVCWTVHVFAGFSVHFFFFFLLDSAHSHVGGSISLPLLIPDLCGSA